VERPAKVRPRSLCRATWLQSAVGILASRASSGDSKVRAAASEDVRSGFFERGLRLAFCDGLQHATALARSGSKWNGDPPAVCCTRCLILLVDRRSAMVRRRVATLASDVAGGLFQTSLGHCSKPLRWLVWRWYVRALCDATGSAASLTLATHSSAATPARGMIS
jgi:hypothetical protein